MFLSAPEVGHLLLESAQDAIFALYQGAFEVENGANPAAPGSAPPAKATGQ